MQSGSASKMAARRGARPRPHAPRPAAHACCRAALGSRPAGTVPPAPERRGEGTRGRTALGCQGTIGSRRRRRASTGAAATRPGRGQRYRSEREPKVVPLCSRRRFRSTCVLPPRRRSPRPRPRSRLSAQAGPAGAGPRLFVLPQCTSFSSAGNKNGEGLRRSRAGREAGLTPPPPPFLRRAAGTAPGGGSLRTEGPAAARRRGEAPELAISLHEAVGTTGETE